MFSIPEFLCKTNAYDCVLLLHRRRTFFLSQYGDRQQVQGRTIEAFSVFRKGIRPDYYEPVNAAGGTLWCWYPVKKIEYLEKAWETLVLTCIGGAVDPDERILGVRVVDRSPALDNMRFRLEIWLKRGPAAHAEALLQRVLDALSGGDDRIKSFLPNFKFKNNKE